MHAVIGGFHLSGLAGERIEQVVDAFREMAVEHIVPQHCTGMEAMVALHRHFPAEVVVSSVGSTFTFAVSSPAGRPDRRVEHEAARRVDICEVGTRDGFQIEPDWIPTELKVEVVDRLSATGCRRSRSRRSCRRRRSPR